jgi:hypothetical protein
MLMILPEMPMYPHSPGKIRLLLVSIFMLFLLSACGQKGELYHPEEKQSSVDPSYYNT